VGKLVPYTRARRQQRISASHRASVAERHAAAAASKGDPHAKAASATGAAAAPNGAAAGDAAACGVSGPHLASEMAREITELKEQQCLLLRELVALRTDLAYSRGAPVTAPPLMATHDTSAPVACGEHSPLSVRTSGRPQLAPLDLAHRMADAHPHEAPVQAATETPSVIPSVNLNPFQRQASLRAATPTRR
jgi:hypothetical protein